MYIVDVIYISVKRCELLIERVLYKCLLLLLFTLLTSWSGLVFGIEYISNEWLISNLSKPLFSPMLSENMPKIKNEHFLMRQDNVQKQQQQQQNALS